jgi:beta-lactam-binding protein with PASTA domain
MVTQELLKSLFDYSNGELIHKNGKSAVIEAGKKRYKRITVGGKIQALHRMIYMWHYGHLPKTIDHIDGNRENNAIENLREVTQQQNCLNRKHTSTSKSPYKNVYLQPPTKNPEWKRNWVVSLMVSGKRKYVGSFVDVELADLVATEARNLYHGQYARNF